MQDDEEISGGQPDIPANSGEMAGQALGGKPPPDGHGLNTSPEQPEKKSLSRLAKGAIFREVVLAKVREEKEKAERERVAREAEHASRSGSGSAA